MLHFLIVSVDNALRTLFSSTPASRPMPMPESADINQQPLNPEEKMLSGALMRVNHVGEICAQALYRAQAVSTANPSLKHHFEKAAGEETDHLAWTRQRLVELGARPSVLNPVWYAGAFAIGLLAGRAGNALSLGFVVETERQVERHLESHLALLPATDKRSRHLVQAMKDDEVRHAVAAENAGAQPLPAPVTWMMRRASTVMTTVAKHL